MKNLLQLFIGAFLAVFFLGHAAMAHVQSTEGMREASEVLIHYWHFNDEVISDDDEVPSDFSLVGEGVITYPGTGDGYMDFRSHRPEDPVSNFNLRMGQEPDQGAILRVRNPADTRELIVAAPSTGHENLVVTFATTRSESGGQEQEFYFSADNGNTWTQVGDAYDVFEHDPEADNFGYVYKVFDLSVYPEVNDNPVLHFRIMSVGEGSDGDSGNQRFDNLSLDGDPVSFEMELLHYWHFNDEVISDDDEVPSDFSLVGEGVITYPGTGDGYMDFRSHRPEDPVSNFNLRMGQEPDQGAILRVRNPADTRELIVAAPATGYENLVVTFAATRSESGGQEQEFYFSADNGDTWTQVGDAYDVFEHDPEADNFGYIYKVIDLSDYPEVNNNDELHFRIMSVGEGSDGSSGNQRFDNFTLDGYVIQTDLPASKLSIVAVNDGDPVYVDESFSLTIQVLNDDDIPTAVEDDTEISISLASGNGTLGGTLSGVIEAGEMSLVFEGILYDTAEEGVSIMADADDLEAAVSDEFDVHVRTYVLTLESFPPGAGVLNGGGDYEAGAEVTVSADSGDDYAFENWTIGDDVISEDAEFVFIMPAEDVTLTASFDMLGDVLLMHYWHFNDEVIEGEEEDYLVISDFSLVGQGGITYPGEGDGYVDFRSHREADPVSNFNLRQGQEPDQGAVLRVRNPAITRELIFAVPSTDFADLVATFATTRTENGSQEQQFYFSPDAGASWTAVGEAYYIPSLPEDEGYLEKIVDLSGHEEVNDNPDLHFKILFVGEGNDNTSGNNRFDNFTVDGRTLSDDVNVQDISTEEPLMQVYPNPATSVFNIEVDQPDMLIRIYDMSGRLVYQRAMNGTSMSLDGSGFNSGLYVIRGFSPKDNVSVTKRLLIQ